MKRHSSIAALIASLLLASTNTLAVEEIIDSLTLPDNNGTLLLNMRSRLEHVEQDNTLRAATAGTLRSRLGYKTRDFEGFAALIEVEDVRAVDDSYNSTTNGEVRHSVIADRGGVDYGNELNLLIVKNFSRRCTVGLKYANYFANEFSTDTEKIQVYAQINI